MNKHPFSESFLRSSLHKALMPLRTVHFATRASSSTKATAAAGVSAILSTRSERRHCRHRRHPLSKEYHCYGHDASGESETQPLLLTQAQTLLSPVQERPPTTTSSKTTPATTTRAQAPSSIPTNNNHPIKTASHSLRGRLWTNSFTPFSSAFTSSPSSTSTTTIATALLLYLSLSLSLLASSSTSLVYAAPKGKPATEDVVHAMRLTFTETSALPLQLQIEAQVKGKQQLAYLPTADSWATIESTPQSKTSVPMRRSAPSLDFYYLNYRPTYVAGTSTLDFWMLTPEGTTAPKTASLELYDEFNRVLLAVLVPAGTKVPANTANKHEPFLWKSWKVPKSLASEFDFSDRFRLVLKTSDDTKVISANVHAKRDLDQADGDGVMAEEGVDSLDLDMFELGVKNKNKIVQKKPNAMAPPAARGAAAAAGAGGVVVQDRQVRIRGLEAVPGGKPNPAKIHINRVLPANPGDTASTGGTATAFKTHNSGASANSDSNMKSIGKQPSSQQQQQQQQPQLETDGTQLSGGSSRLPRQHEVWAVAMTMVMALALGLSSGAPLL